VRISSSIHALVLVTLSASPAVAQSGPEPQGTEPAVAQPEPDPQGAEPAQPEPEPQGTSPKSVDRSHDYVHHGFYLRFGAGASFLDLTGDGPAGSARLSGFGPALTLAIGGTLEDGLVVAGTWHLSLGASSPPTGPLEGHGNLFIFSEQLGLLVDWYPDPRGGWHVGGAVGVGILGADAINGSVGGLSGIDATASLLGGYDWWIARKWTLGVQAVATGGARTGLDGSDLPGPSYRLGVASLSLEGVVLFN
jgi:hypothetical protein